MLKASAILRAVDVLRKDGKSTIFNDMMKDGGRSFKVWGWGNADYGAAVMTLEAAGYEVMPVVTARRGKGSWARGGEVRLWVWG